MAAIYPWKSRLSTEGAWTVEYRVPGRGISGPSHFQTVMRGATQRFTRRGDDLRLPHQLRPGSASLSWLSAMPALWSASGSVLSGVSTTHQQRKPPKPSACNWPGYDRRGLNVTGPPPHRQADGLGRRPAHSVSPRRGALINRLCRCELRSRAINNSRASPQLASHGQRVDPSWAHHAGSSLKR